MSCRRARVKIKIGMVTFSHPCVHIFIWGTEFVEVELTEAELIESDFTDTGTY